MYSLSQDEKRESERVRLGGRVLSFLPTSRHYYLENVAAFELELCTRTVKID